MDCYANWQCPLYKDETKKVKFFDLPLYGRFQTISPMAVNGLWHVMYTYKGINFPGYIEDRFVEYYNQNLPYDLVDLRDIQTPEDSDAEQYIIWDAKRQYNMCGQISVAYILGLPLAEVLRKWKELDVPFYKRVMGASGTTGNYDLIKLLGIFGRVATPLTMKKYTPRLLSELVQNTKAVIVSVHLNTQNGSLVGGKVLHWGIVTKVVCEGLDAGWVEIYNPFTNSIQLLSWREFLATTRAPYGVIT
jgi:hypothetical protein